MNDPDSKLQKVLAALVCCMCVFFMGCGSTHGHTAAENYSKMTPEEIVDSLTLEQKTAQMLLPAVYNIDEQKMSEIDYGAVLSKKESLPASEWRITVDQLQTAALDSQAAVPYLYGQDDVHGVNYCLDTVIFRIILLLVPQTILNSQKRQAISQLWKQPDVICSGTLHRRSRFHAIPDGEEHMNATAQIPKL